MELRIKHKDILVGAWLNEGKKNVIISPGLPQYIDKHHSVIKKLSQMGCNIFTPRYIGSWESDGEFSIHGCVETLEQAIGLVRSGEGVEAYNARPARWSKEATLYIVGFSFGALPTLLVKTDAPKIVICPFVSSMFHSEKTKGEDIRHTFDFLYRGYPNVYRLNVAELMEELEGVRYAPLDGHLSMVVGLNDEVIPAEEIDFIVKKFNPNVTRLPIDHSMSDIEADTWASLLS